MRSSEHIAKHLTQFWLRIAALRSLQPSQIAMSDICHTNIQNPQACTICAQNSRPTACFPPPRIRMHRRLTFFGTSSSSLFL